MTGLRHLTVPLDDRSYEVVVGPGAASYLGSVLPTGARRAAIVTQESRSRCTPTCRTNGS